MNSKFTLKASLCAAVLALSAWAATPVFASTANPCPVPNGGSSGGEGVAGLYTTDSSGGTVGCNVLITFEANGTIVTTNPNGAGYYDSGGDDNLVGVVNLTGNPINSLTLSSATDNIFGFEGDGICGSPGYTFVGGGSPCSGATDPNGYGGPGVTYSGINGAQMSGTVNFAGGIAASGGTAFFSLEGPVALDLQVNGVIPEPSSYLLFGTGLLGLLYFARRKVLA
jgi:hypothetical protein